MENLKQRVLEKLKSNRLTIHHCSFCHYPCAFTMVKGVLYYDAGCDCTGMGIGNFEPREIDELDFYLTHRTAEIEDWVSA